MVHHAAPLRQSVGLLRRLICEGTDSPASTKQLQTLNLHGTAPPPTAVDRHSALHRTEQFFTAPNRPTAHPSLPLTAPSHAETACHELRLWLYLLVVGPSKLGCFFKFIQTLKKFICFASLTPKRGIYPNNCIGMTHNLPRNILKLATYLAQNVCFICSKLMSIHSEKSSNSGRLYNHDS